MAGAVAAVLNNATFFGVLAQHILEERLLVAMGTVACASQTLRAATEFAAKHAVLKLWPSALSIDGEPWSAHWVILAALSHDTLALAALCRALYGAEGGSFGAPSSEVVTVPRVADRACASLVGIGRNRHTPPPRIAGAHRSGVQRLLGSQGPVALLSRQRRLLRRLCIEAGGLRHAPVLARLNMNKACGSCEAAPALLDLAEVLNLRAYARTYVSRRPKAGAEIEEALDAASLVRRCSSEAGATPRARLLLGRTLASAAHAAALGSLDDPICERLRNAWGSTASMFHAAEAEFEGALTAIGPVADASDRGILTAAWGECFYCVASVAEYEGRTEFCREASLRSRTLFEEAIAIFCGSSSAVCSVEYADALKDYGKVLLCFFASDADVGLDLLGKSLSLHSRLLGCDHPRTQNVQRLLSDSHAA